jgi:hypothetical protein
LAISNNSLCTQPSLREAEAHHHRLLLNRKDFCLLPSLSFDISSKNLHSALEIQVIHFEESFKVSQVLLLLIQSNLFLTANPEHLDHFMASNQFTV